MLTQLINLNQSQLQTLCLRGCTLLMMTLPALGQGQHQASKHPMTMPICNSGIEQVTVLSRGYPDTDEQTWPVSERLTIRKSGRIEYFAYFHNMPISSNHTDRTQWQASTPVSQAFQELQALLARELDDRQIEVVAEVDTDPAQGFLIDCITQRYRIGTPSSNAYRRTAAALAALLEDFAQSTGRPLHPSQLPQ